MRESLEKKTRHIQCTLNSTVDRYNEAARFGYHSLRLVVADMQNRSALNQLYFVTKNDIKCKVLDLYDILHSSE